MSLQVKPLEDLQFLLSHHTGSLTTTGPVKKIRVHANGKIFAVSFFHQDTKIYLFSEPIGNACEIMEILNIGSKCDFCFSPNSLLLAVVSSRGDALMYDVSQIPATRSTIQLHRFVSPNFSAVEFSKDSSMISIVSDVELIIVEKREKWKQTKPVLEFSNTSDFVPAIAIHPENCAVAISSTSQRAVLVVGVPGYRPNVQQNLRARPVEEGGSPLGSPTGGAAHLNPNILNVIPLANGARGVPIACVWSPYGEILAIATSDNFLTIWNISTSALETFALDEGTVIRDIFFLSDSLLVVSTSDESKIICVNVDDGVMFDTQGAPAEAPGKTFCGGSLSNRIMYKPRNNRLVSRFQLTV